MSRQSPFGHPFLLGFDEIEQALDRVAKAAGDGYPPYNIERLARTEQEPERLRITLAVAGFTRDQLDVALEENQLVIRGRQAEDKARQELRARVEALQLGDGRTLGEAAASDGRVAAAVDRSLRRMHVFNVDYDNDRTAKVRAGLDLRYVWQELNRR